MFIGKKSCIHRTVSTHICSQPYIHKSMSLNSPVHGPIDIVAIHAHIFLLGMQISGDTHILTKVCDCTRESPVGERMHWSRSEHKPERRTIPVRALKIHMVPWRDIPNAEPSTCTIHLLCTQLGPKFCVHTHTSLGAQSHIHTEAGLVPWCWGPEALERLGDFLEEGPWF